MKTRDGRLARPGSRRTRVFSLVVLAVAAQAGCTREFFREWANQDVSEAVFEKSRDPRWRLDLFSVDPPALARYADPYDPDRPPAPPDDRAAEASSPVPQWPDNRLLVPAEGTGYLDMLEAWKRDHPADERRPSTEDTKPVKPKPGDEKQKKGPAAPPAPPAEGTRAPFGSAPDPENITPTPPLPDGGTRETPTSMIPSRNALLRANSGPNTPRLSPNSGTGSSETVSQAAPGSDVAEESNDLLDPKLTQSAFQDTGLPMPVTPPSRPPASTTPGIPRDLPTPPVGMDPDPINSDLSDPVNPRPDLSPEEYRTSEAVASELAGILVPKAVDFSEAEAAGLPRDSQPYVLTMEQAFTLTLINSRSYQSQLENLYLSALSVTLQRWQFTPQFYAGISPTTGLSAGGFPPPNPNNQFIYATAETGNPLSTLNLGQVAGFGKVFQTGARLLAGFASQLVFNFNGNNPVQPTVRGFLPLTLVQPFLRGGGRAVTLEALTQAERTLLYAVRAFAKFRQEFVVATLVGGQIPNIGTGVPSLGFSGGTGGDPAGGFLPVLVNLQQVENQIRNVAAFEQIVLVYTELISGEGSGLTQLQLDQVQQQLQNARQQLIVQRNQYRSNLDSFKMQMGLPPDTPLILDRRINQVFKRVFDEVDEWQRNPKRELDNLTVFANELPQLEDVVIDGRSVLDVYKEGKNDEDDLEELLLSAERVALERRLDLMNARAALYDSWRQLRVTANALMGTFNVSLTNTYLTPPSTNNPFAFVDQAKQFSLVLNAELPLVRLAERNQFRSALINYQRQRRALMQTEDTLKLNIRNDIRALHLSYLSYEIQRRNFVLLIRQKDQAFEQIIAPPTGAATAGSTQGAVQTNNLITAQNQLLGTENQLINIWTTYQQNRLALYRDLGTLPYDEWEAFHELFPEEPISPGPGPATFGARPTGATTPPAGAEAPPVGR